jgi:hypothetical protein
MHNSEMAGTLTTAYVGALMCLFGNAGLSNTERSNLGASASEAHPKPATADAPVDNSDLTLLAEPILNLVC